MANKKNVYEVLKYIISAGISFAVDLLLFTIFNYFLKEFSYSIILATVIARILSCFVNYYMNSRFVFSKFTRESKYKYFALVVIQMIISAISVHYLKMLFININETVIKTFVDILIFIINYFIQKIFIFTDKK